MCHSPCRAAEEAVLKNILYNIISEAAAFMLLFILLITSFQAVCYWTPDYYEQEFQKHESLAQLKYWRDEDMTMEDLRKVMKQTMIYLKGDRENLIVVTRINGSEVQFYNENEKSHMADVRDLFIRAQILRAVFLLSVLAAAGFLVVMEHGRGLWYLGRGCFRVFVVFLILLAVLSIVTALDFNRSFTLFHEIFFHQGNWLFDPRESRMIDVLSEGFFADTAVRILALFVGSILVLLIPSGLLSRFAGRLGYSIGS